VRQLFPPISPLSCALFTPVCPLYRVLCSIQWTYRLVMRRSLRTLPLWKVILVWRISVFTAWFHAPVVSVPQFSVVKLVDSISIISIGAFVFKSGGHFPACVVTFGML
jgi:hypothetical protein